MQLDEKVASLHFVSVDKISDEATWQTSILNPKSRHVYLSLVLKFVLDTKSAVFFSAIEADKISLCEWEGDARINKY